MTRLEKLYGLEKELKALMDKANSRTFASLARQYRETIKEIEEIEGREGDNDEIAKILGESNGMPGAVRKNRSKV